MYSSAFKMQYSFTYLTYDIINNNRTLLNKILLINYLEKDS